MISGVDQASLQDADNTKPATIGADTPVSAPIVVESRQSKALLIWLTVVVGVLAVLFVQMQVPGSSNNFLIEATDEDVGANVTIDGKSLGALQEEDSAGVKMVVLRTSLSDGTHHIEITKPGYKPFSKDIDLRGEDFLGVQLSKQ